MNPVHTTVIVVFIVLALLCMCLREYNRRREEKGLMNKLTARGERQLFNELQEQLGLVLASEHVPPNDPRWLWTRMSVATLSRTELQYNLAKIQAELTNPEKHPGILRPKINDSARDAMSAIKGRKAKLADLSKPRHALRTVKTLEKF